MIGLPQRSQESAGAAAEIEHTGAGRDQLRDALIIEPVLVENNGGAMRLVLHGGWRLGRGTELVEESPHHLAINSQVIGQQESIMAAGAPHVAITDRRVVGDQRINNVAGLVGWKQPVA